MANSMRNYVCITESGEVRKYASQSIGQIIEEKESFHDPYISITSIGLTSVFDSDDGFEKLEWHD